MFPPPLCSILHKCNFNSVRASFPFKLSELQKERLIHTYGMPQPLSLLTASARMQQERFIYSVPGYGIPQPPSPSWQPLPGCSRKGSPIAYLDMGSHCLHLLLDSLCQDSVGKVYLCLSIVYLDRGSYSLHLLLDSLCQDAVGKVHL